MTTRILTLSVPEPLLDQLTSRARLRHRSVEDETLELLAASAPGDELPQELSAAIAPLAMLDDDALGRAAASHLAAEAAAALEALHHKRQREGLTPAEQEETNALLRHYERAMLVRAQAAALLNVRRHQSPEAGVAP